MMQPLEIHNFKDENGNPTGGYVEGVGVKIEWQNGPLGRHVEGCQPEVPAEEKLAVEAEGCTRKEPNGAFVEGVIAAALARIEFYQESKFRCVENEMAASSLRTALSWLNYRTSNREAKAVEGTHAV